MSEFALDLRRGTFYLKVSICLSQCCSGVSLQTDIEKFVLAFED